MTITITESSNEQLRQRREQILAGLGMSLDELRSRRESGAMCPEEWAAWEELESINYLVD